MKAAGLSLSFSLFFFVCSCAFNLRRLLLLSIPLSGIAQHMWFLPSPPSLPPSFLLTISRHSGLAPPNTAAQHSDRPPAAAPWCLALSTQRSPQSIARPQGLSSSLLLSSLLFPLSSPPSSSLLPPPSSFLFPPLLPPPFLPSSLQGAPLLRHIGGAAAAKPRAMQTGGGEEGEGAGTDSGCCCALPCPALPCPAHCPCANGGQVGPVVGWGGHRSPLIMEMEN